MFAVLQLNQTIEIQVYGKTEKLPLSYADGMVGAIPVFDTKEQAEAFADGRYKIAEIKT